MTPIIALLTDYGLEGPYVGALKGAILSINPQATIVDLTHLVAPGDVLHGAFLLASASAPFPVGTLYVAVVDPGVGTSRRPIALQTERGIFVGPDNGLFSHVLGGARRGRAMRKGTAPRLHPLQQGQRAVHLQEPRFWRQPVSRTFHGRDIFAPVAAHLSLGVPLDALGSGTDEVLAFSLPRAVVAKGGGIRGEVISADRFGNLITCIREEDLPTGAVRVEIAGNSIAGLSRSYAEGGGLLAIIGGDGLLEVALMNGSAAEALGAGVGTEVRVAWGRRGQRAGDH